MKTIDYLQLTAIQDKILEKSGMSLEQINALQIDSAEKAIARLNSLNLSLPFPSHPNARLIRSTSSACRAYHPIKTSKQGFSKGAKQLTVVSSFAIQKDDKLWQHVSASAEKMPSYQELCWVKQIFIGEDKTAIQVFPKASEHVNDHATCLHLWCCLEADVLPDFSWFGTV